MTQQADPFSLSPEEQRFINESADPRAAEIRELWANTAVDPSTFFCLLEAAIADLRNAVAAAQGRTTQAVDPFGHQAETKSAASGKTLIVIYGEPETGKSTQANIVSLRKNMPRPDGSVAPDGCMLIQTNGSVAAPYQSWMEHYPDQAAALGSLRVDEGRYETGNGWARRETILEFQSDGRTPHNNWSQLHNLLGQIAFLRASAIKYNRPERWPFAGVLIDEAGGLLGRVLRDMMAECTNPQSRFFKSKTGAADPFKAWAALGDFLSQITSMARGSVVQAGPFAGTQIPPMLVTLVCHPRMPDPQADELGCPHMPSKNLSMTLAKEADILLRFFKKQVRGLRPAGPPAIPVLPTPAAAQAPGTSGTPGTPAPATQQAVAPPTEDEGWRKLLLYPDEPVDNAGMVRRIQISSDPKWYAKTRDFGEAKDGVGEVPLDLLNTLRRVGVMVG